MKTVKGRIFTREGKFEYGEIDITDDIIIDVRLVNEDSLTEQERSTRIIPGLIDIHMHGCAGYDTCDASKDSLIKMAMYEKAHGITSFCPATMTLDEKRLSEICSVIKKAVRSVKNDKMCSHSLFSNIKGIYLEGPFISEKKAGAQKKCFIKKPDIDMFERLWTCSGENIKVVAIAPETEGAIEFIKKVSSKTICSIAHTDADYDTVMEAVRAGAAQVTHLYNAMSGLSHRAPGVVGAVFESGTLMAELICDGQHIHDAVIRTTFKTLGDDRVILISDSMEATGMPDGEYILGENKVIKRGNRAELEDGVLAGSVTNLFDCMKYAISAGIPEKAAIFAATRNPAVSLGIYDTVGSIEKGKKADLVLMSQEYEVKKVIQHETQV